MSYDYHQPRFKFICQRASAKARGIEWFLTYEEWLTIWLESGQWHSRGPRVGGYVMARHGDAGPYAVGNVAIITHAQNLSDANRKQAGLPIGVYVSGRRFVARRTINGKLRYLGTHATPEEARAAYERAA